MGEIRIVGPGKTHGYPYPVCKKMNFSIWFFTICYSVCDFFASTMVCLPVWEIIHLLLLVEYSPIQVNYSPIQADKLWFYYLIHYATLIRVDLAQYELYCA